MRKEAAVATKPGPVKARDPLNSTNFRQFAEDAIKVYEKKGMILDALLWHGIIGHYNAALDDANKRAGASGG